MILQLKIQMESMPNNEQLLQQHKLQLKTLQEKCDLQGKKIKLFRKENEQLKNAMTRQRQIDTSLLLASKELSDANVKLQTAISDISRKLQIDLTQESNSHASILKPLSTLITINNTTVTEQTEELDMAQQNLTDEDVMPLQPFNNIKSLLLGENKLKDKAVGMISQHMTGLTKLQLNSNSFTADALIPIVNLKVLKVLDIRNNKLGDTCTPYVASLSQLQELSISKNNISDEGIKQISKLLNLNYLDLTTNQITDKGVVLLMSLKKLTHVYLMSNPVTEQSVFLIFYELPLIEVLDVRFNINNQAKKEAIRAQKPSKLQLFC